MKTIFSILTSGSSSLTKFMAGLFISIQYAYIILRLTMSNGQTVLDYLDYSETKTKIQIWKSDELDGICEFNGAAARA